MFARVFVAAGADRREADQLDHAGRDKATIELVGGKPATDRPANRRQCLGETGKAAGLQHLAHLGPFGMIAILQPAGRVLANRLQMRRVIGREAYVDVGGRHGQ